ncbi:MAG: hypothetical protein H6842_13000 [Rhodospirillaceae bacterium]|nr:hypothetical protein [Rhodospirillaceae bacterium]
MAEIQYLASPSASEEEDVTARAQALACCLKQLAEECDVAGLYETADLIRTAALSALEEAGPMGASRH